MICLEGGCMTRRPPMVILWLSWSSGQF